MTTIFDRPRFRELLEATVEGEFAGIHPFSFWKHQPGADQDSSSFAAASVMFQRQFQPDFAKLTPASTYQVIDYGVRDCWDGDYLGRRQIVSRPVATSEDWLRLPRLNPFDGFASRIVRALALVRKRLPRNVPVIPTVFNPYFQAVALAGPEMVRLHRQEAPEALSRGLATIAENTAELISAFVEAGADGLFLASQHIHTGVLTEAEYRTFALEGDRACLCAARPMPFNVFHLHGVGVHFDLARELPAAILHYDAAPGNPGPAAALSGRQAIATGLAPEGEGLLTDPGTARGEALDALRRWGGGSRFILAPGCAIPLSVPAECLLAVAEAAASFSSSTADSRGALCRL